MASKTYLYMKMTDGNDKAVNEGRTGNQGIEGNDILMISPGAALHTVEMQMQAEVLTGWDPSFDYTEDYTVQTTIRYCSATRA